jgi:hypothetical protein
MQDQAVVADGDAVAAENPHRVVQHRARAERVELAPPPRMHDLAAQRDTRHRLARESARTRPHPFPHGANDTAHAPTRSQ